MRKISLVLQLCLISSFVFMQNISASNDNLDRIKIYYASLDKPEANPIKEFEVKTHNEVMNWGSKLDIVPECEFQTIEGIGGAFNEIGGEAFAALKSDDKKELMLNLFGDDNAGFSFCRTAMGSSDFGLDAYSYSEVAEDYDMSDFSIDRDKKYVLPYIKAAIKANPDLEIFASPWSPPAWMKQNKVMTGKAVNNTLREDKKIYKAYAQYFVNYIQAYSENGVDINRVCIQNETDANTIYPSNIMSAEQMVTLGVDYIKPAFKKSKLKTEVYAGTLRSATTLQLHKYVIQDKADQLDGIGIQYISPQYISEVANKFPKYTFMHTESNCNNGKNSIKEAENRLGEIARYINSGCVNFCYWNMILNETTESSWDWTQNSLIIIDRNTGNISYNPDYNPLYLVSKFVKKGDVRIASLSNSSPIISVKSKNGTIKLVTQNTNVEEKAYQITIDDSVYNIMLPARAICAIEIAK